VFWVRADGLAGGDSFQRDKSSLARCSRLTIAGGVRGNNWTEERLRCKWPTFFFFFRALFPE